MEDWIETELSSLFKISTGNTPFKKISDNYGSFIPFIKPPQLLNKPISDAKEFLSKKGKEKGRVLPPSSILITCIGNLGRVGINKAEVAFNQQINAIHPNKLIESLFIYYQAQSPFFRRQLEEKSSATTVALVNKGSFETVKFRLPPLPTQRAIVSKLESLLTNLDQGIASLEKAAAQLKIYRQAVLKKAFEGELTKAWRAQQIDLPTAEELLTQIKEERLKHYEQQLQDWEKAVTDWEDEGKVGRKPSKPKKLKELLPFDKNELEELVPLSSNSVWIRLGSVIGELSQGWSPKCVNTPAEENEWGVIKTSAIQDGYFLQNQNKTLPESLEPRIKHELKKGDILITRAGPRVRVGICCLVKNVRKKLINSDKVYRIRTIQNSCKPEFLALLLSSPHFKSKIEKIKTGISDSGVNIKQDIFIKMAMPICSFKEQDRIIQEIESRLSVCDYLAETIETSLKKAKALRQSILKKAFEGRLLTAAELAACRAAPDYEPAAVLLERIKKEKAEREALAKAEKKNKSKKGKLTLKIKA